MSNPPRARALACAPSRKAAARTGAWGLTVGLLLAGCSGSDDRRDQFYGTDVGVGYTLPDSGSDAGEVGATDTVAADAGHPTPPGTDAGTGADTTDTDADAADAAAVPDQDAGPDADDAAAGG